MPKLTILKLPILRLFSLAFHLLCLNRNTADFTKARRLSKQIINSSDHGKPFWFLYREPVQVTNYTVYSYTRELQYTGPDLLETGGHRLQGDPEMFFKITQYICFIFCHGFIAFVLISLVLISILITLFVYNL